MSLSKEQIRAFFTNPILLACVSSWLAAQLIKTLIKLFSGKVHTLVELFELLFWKTGGMPSSHSAFVTCLCTTIGFRAGINDNVFFLSLGFLFVTIRDALGVRRASGIQAKMINKIGRNLEERELMEFKPVKEVQGHTPAEVAIGVIIGFFIGLAFSVLK